MLIFSSFHPPSFHFIDRSIPQTSDSSTNSLPLKRLKMQDSNDRLDCRSQPAFSKRRPDFVLPSFRCCYLPLSSPPPPPRHCRSQCYVSDCFFTVGLWSRSEIGDIVEREVSVYLSVATIDNYCCLFRPPPPLLSSASPSFFLIIPNSHVPSMLENFWVMKTFRKTIYSLENNKCLVCSFVFDSSLAARFSRQLPATSSQF